MSITIKQNISVFRDSCTIMNKNFVLDRTIKQQNMLTESQSLGFGRQARHLF